MQTQNGDTDTAGREGTTDTTTTQRAQPGIEEDELTHFIAECLALALVEDVRVDRADLYSETGEASTSLSDTASPTPSPTTEGGTTTEKEVEPADEVPD